MRKEPLARKFLGAIMPTLVGVALVGAVVFLYILPSIEANLLKKKRELIRETTQIVISILNGYQAQVEAGSLGLAQAQARAKARIRDIRYGPELKDYFWIQDKDLILVHPYMPALVGRHAAEVFDKRGKPLGSEFFRVAHQEGEGYIKYYWQWEDDPSRLEEKLSYVKLFRPWDWVVGTGVYLEDVQAEIGRLTQATTALGALLVALVGVITGFTSWRQYQADRRKRQTEQALFKTYQEYSAVLQTSPNPIVFYDLEGRATYVNPAFTRYFGWRPEEVIGQRIDYVPQGLADQVEREVARCYQDPDTPVSFESTRLTKDGGTLEVSLNAAIFKGPEGRPTGMVVCLTDITAIKRAQEALRESEELFRALAENSLDVIKRFDRQGRHLYANPMAEKLLGRPVAEMLGRTHAELGYPEPVPSQVAEAVEQVFSDGGPRRLELLVPGGRWIDTLFFPEFDHHGQVKAVLASGRDVTARRQDEEERIRLEAQLRQTQKLEAIGTLAGGIAHDFNNILSAVVGYTELGLLRLQQGVSPVTNLNKVLEACNRAKELIKQILTFCRSSEDLPRPVELRLIAKEVVRLMRATLPANIEIRSSLASPATVMADPTQMHQMLMNLCTNAAQAMGEAGGILELGLALARVREDDPQAPDLAPGEYLMVTVADSGPGVPADIHDKIFDPFFTTKGPTEGTGLGLAVVHGIVSKYGGRITLASPPGQGATFRVLLPCVRQQAPARVEWSLSGVPTGQESILLVDDEPDLVDTGRQKLEALGYKVTATNSAEAALRMFRAEPRAYDLLFTDYAMPLLSGLDLARAVLAMRPGLPVIIYSGRASQVPEDQALDLGISLILHKPLDIAELGRAVRQVLDQAAPAPEPPAAPAA